MKDLSKLGRNLNQVIIVDNVWDNFKLQQKNGIYIKTWEGDPNDDCLNELKYLLIEIAKSNVDDLREALRKIRDVMFRLYLEGKKNPYRSVIKILRNEAEGVNV